LADYSNSVLSTKSISKIDSGTENTAILDVSGHEDSAVRNLTAAG